MIKMRKQIMDKIEKSEQAWVVFSGKTELSWLKLLKPGFRHCFVLLNDGKNWISIDPMSNHMEVTVHHVPKEFDLPLWLKDRGNTVVKADRNLSQTKPAPYMMMTCVEVVKRVIGLHKRTILTPWQLYRHLAV